MPNAKLDESQAGIKIARRNIYNRKWRGTKEHLEESERGEWKTWLKTQYSKK